MNYVFSLKKYQKIKLIHPFQIFSVDENTSLQPVFFDLILYLPVNICHCICIVLISMYVCHEVEIKYV